MASPRVLDGLWVALARRARRWADRVLAERGSEPTSPAEPADTGEPYPDDGPPAHWLEMVRARAPHLLPVRDRTQRAARARAEGEAETETASPDRSVADLVRGDDGPVQRTPDVAGERPHRAAAQPSAPAHASTSVARTRAAEAARAEETARAAETARPPETTGPRSPTRPAARARERETTEPGDVPSSPKTSGVREIARPTTPWPAAGNDAGAPLVGDAPTAATRRHDLGSTPDDGAHPPTSWRDAPPPPGGAAATPTSWQRERTPRPASTQPQASWSSGLPGAAPGQTVWQREALRRGEADADGDPRPAPRRRADDTPPFASAPPVRHGSPPTAARGEGEIERRQRTIHPAPTAVAPGAHRLFAPGDRDAMRPPPPPAADAIARAPRAPLASLAPLGEAPPSSALWPRLPDEQRLDPPVPGDDLPWPQLPVDDLAVADGPRHSEDRGRLDRLRLEQRGMRWSERRF